MSTTPAATMENEGSGAAKAALRNRLADIRAGAAERHPGAADGLGTLFDEFCWSLSVLPGSVVAGYWPIRTELSPLPLMAEMARGREAMSTALPATPEPGGALAFRSWKEGDGLVDGRHGIREPTPDAPAADPDILLVPLLAFDGRCNRVGYGGGYYDRTIAALRTRRPHVRALGIAYAEQMVDALPVEAHDARLDAVLTPEWLVWGAAAGDAGLE